MTFESKGETGLFKDATKGTIGVDKGRLENFLGQASEKTIVASENEHSSIEEFSYTGCVVYAAVFIEHAWYWHRAILLATSSAFSDGETRYLVAFDSSVNRPSFDDNELMKNVVEKLWDYATAGKCRLSTLFAQDCTEFVSTWLQVKVNTVVMQWTRRLNVLFSSESIVQFFGRRFVAMKRREMAKSHLRYRRHLDDIDDGGFSLDSSWEQHIFDRGTQNGSLSTTRGGSLEEVVLEFREDYVRAMKHATHQYMLNDIQYLSWHVNAKLPCPNIPVGNNWFGLVDHLSPYGARQNAASSLAAVLVRHWEPIWYPTLRLQNNFYENFFHRTFIDCRLPLRYRKDIPTEREKNEDRDRMRKRMRRKLFQSRDSSERRRSSVDQQGAAQRVGEMLMSMDSQVDIPLPESVNSWLERQHEAMEYLKEDLSAEWKAKFVTDAYECLQTKYNMYMRDFELYERHPLKPMVTRTTLIMDHQLRMLTDNSINDYVNFVLRSCEHLSTSQILQDELDKIAGVANAKDNEMLRRTIELGLYTAAKLNSRFNGLLLECPLAFLTDMKSKSVDVTEFIKHEVVNSAGFDMPLLNSTPDIDAREDARPEALYAFLQPKRMDHVCHRPPLLSVHLELGKVYEIPSRKLFAKDKVHPSIELLSEFDEGNYVYRPYSRLRLHPIANKQDCGDGSEQQKEGNRRKDHKGKKHRKRRKSVGPEQAEQVLPPGCEVFSRPNVKTGSNPTAESAAYFVKVSPNMGHVEQCLIRTLNFIASGASDVESPITSLLSLLPIETKSIMSLAPVDESPLASKISNEFASNLSYNNHRIEEIEKELHGIFSNNAKQVKEELEGSDGEEEEVEQASATEGEGEGESGQASESATSSPREQAKKKEKSLNLSEDDQERVKKLCEELDGYVPGEVEKSSIENVVNDEMEKVYERIGNADSHTANTQIRFEVTAALLKGVAALELLRPSLLASAYSRYAWLMTISPNDITKGTTVKKQYDVFSEIDEFLATQESEDYNGQGDTQEESSHEEEWELESQTGFTVEDDSLVRQVAEMRGSIDSFYPSPIDSKGRRVVRYDPSFDGRLKSSALLTEERRLMWKRKQEAQPQGAEGVLEEQLAEMEEEYVRQPRKQLIEDEEAELYQYWSAGQQVQRLSDNKVWFGLIGVDCEKVKSQLGKRARDLSNAVAAMIIEDCERVSSQIERAYRRIKTNISEPPKDASGVEQQRNLLNRLDRIVQGLDHAAEETIERLERLRRFDIKLPHQALKDVWAARGVQSEVYTASQHAEAHLNSLSDKLVQKLEKEKEMFMNEVETWPSKVEEFKTKGSDVQDLEDHEAVEKLAEEAMAFQDKIEAGLQTVQDFYKKEKIFNQPSGDFAIVSEISEEFIPYYRLWSTIGEFDGARDRWLTGSFKDLNANEIKSQVEDWLNTTFGLISRFNRMDVEVPLEIAKNLKKKLLEFQHIVPIVESLANPAMKEQHWADVSEVLGLGGEEGKHMLDPEEGLTLQDLLDAGVEHHIGEVEQVAMVATKQYDLERSLELMQSKWDETYFTLGAYKNTGVSIIKEVDEVNTLLDEQLVKIQSMLTSPYVAHVEQKCKQWEAKLLDTTNLIDAILSVQRNWLYLEPIFGSGDIMRQMPNEGRKFTTVDQTWRRTMHTIEQNPRVMDVVDQPGILQTFENADAKLDEIQKGLDAYLELKRLSFPRFFFLSNDELLEILSETKDPRRVQPHLGKSFEGISSLAFEESDHSPEEGVEDNCMVTAMTSAQGETLKFPKSIYPNEGNRRGNVEVWMNDVEANMRKSVIQYVFDSLSELRKAPEKRKEWVLRWPGQVVLAVDMIMWTYGAEHALRKKDKEHAKHSLKKFLDRLNNELMEIVDLVRGDLKGLQRTTLTALTTIDVHARDVISHLIDIGVSDVNDFEWMAQLRYYWNQREDKVANVGDLNVKIINSGVMYGCEYLGNTERLVITPLTDRCYRTLIGAIHLLYGGAPQGPAGTGKTETTKDLAKAVAIQCVVFNCSDGLDYKAMAKFFKGLASSGAWSCFDEFNRIDLEVLSVIAQQILSIQKAKQENAKRFAFEGSTLTLNPTCNVFITMNPGYAGRSELPDNLKALFRPCAMMVPDYALIAEIVLYSYGFSDARAMASKIVQVLKLASEQLSSQHHYDYGMRAVKSILVAAGLLKRRLDWGESQLVLKAIEDVNIPKFTGADIPLFRGIVGDLFPGVENVSEKDERLDSAIVSTMESQNLQTTSMFMQKTHELQNTIDVRHGLMVLGRTCSGKSTVMRVLSKSMTNLAREEEESRRDNPEHSKSENHYNEVHSKFINPKAVALGELYGKFDENTHEWTDGILALAVRSFAKSRSSANKWLVFDGPVDAVWIENMNTVLDDNKKLCLMSGEIIKLTDKMRMIFEVGDLSQASPATVSRCGMVLLEPEGLGYSVFITSWLNSLPESVAKVRSIFEEMKKIMLDPVFDSLEAFELTTPQTSQGLCLAFIRLLDTLIRSIYQEHFQQDSNGQPLGNASVQNVATVFVFSLIWSVGAGLTMKGRHQFDEQLRNLLRDSKINTSPDADKPTEKNLDSLVKIPEEHQGNKLTVFDSFPHIGVIEELNIPSRKASDEKKSQGWVPWLSLVDSGGKFYNIPDGTMFDEITVPTTEMVQQQAMSLLLLNSEKHVLLAGPTGTGKSVGVKQALSQLDAEKYMQISIQFSAQTSSAKTQTIIDEKLRKRRAGVYGPSLGRKAVVFIDDLNMPAKEKYGAQPPIELLRQWMDYNGWYDREERGKPFRKIVDLLFVAAMGPPGGGRSDVTQRYIRHYNVISCLPFSESSLNRIFGSILSWITEGNSPTVPSSKPSSTKVKKLVPDAVTGLTQIYDTLLDELKPTPAKSHYTFNLRDLTALYAGFASVNADSLQTAEDLARLLGHECERVFGDRLVDEEDSQWFTSMMIETLEHRLGVKWNHCQEVFFQKIVSDREKERKLEAEVDELYQKLQSHQKDMEEFEAEAKERAKAASDQKEEKKSKKKKKHKKLELLPEDQSHLEHLKEKVADLKSEYSEAKKKAARDTQQYCVKEDFPEEERNEMEATAEDGADSNTIYFGNFFRMDSEGQIEESGRVYEQAHGESVLSKVLGVQLDQYNEHASAGNRMDLVLFRLARKHVVGISRRLSQASGHCLLLGVGGSGRRSFARLAAFTQQCKIYEPVVTQSYSIMDWQEDVKAVLQLAGLEGRRTVLLINDSDLTNDSQWEDVNNMLNTGEVPNIFTDEEYSKIISELQPHARSEAEREWKRKHGEASRMPPLSPSDVMDYFVKCCKRSLRVVVAMSPVGGDFRSRLRRFPALVNCCYIDWFRPWPAEALSTVARSVLATCDSPIQSDDVEKVISTCVEIHLSVQELSKDLYKQHGLVNYITPTLYLNFLNQLSELIKRESKSLSDKQSKYSVGLKSVAESEELVSTLKQEVIELQPVLEKSKEEAAKVMVDIEKQQKQADETKNQMKEEEAICSEQARQASTMKQECEDDLAEALPALKAAQDALKNLKKSDIVEVKSMGKPPEAVKLVLETVCIMMDIKPDKVTAENGRDKVNDYWTPAKKHLLSDPKLVGRLLKYDKDNIPEETVKQLQPYIDQPDFTPETVQKSSYAASGLCRWVRAILKYNAVSKTVEPKRRALKEAEEKYQKAQAVLKEKEQQLQDVNDQLARLMQQFEETDKRKKDLEQQMEQCQGRLNRANILIDSLGGQKAGWRDKAEDLAKKSESVVTNMLLSGGMIGYLGPYPSDLRATALLRWEFHCESIGLTFGVAHNAIEPEQDDLGAESSRELSARHESARSESHGHSHEPRFSLQDVLGDPITIRSWNANYLPVDKFSIENGIILFQSNKWPLMIDPQGQATRWIRAQSESKEENESGSKGGGKERGVSAGQAGSSGVVSKLRKGNKKQQSKAATSLRVLQPDSPGFYRAIEAAIQYGHHVLIENVGEELDPFLDSILLNEIRQQGSMRVIQLGQNIVEFNSSFKLYMSSRMATPHYSPETRAKVNLLNFTATPAGLQDQMLGVVVAKENPEMEQQRQKWVQETAENSMQLQKTEDKVLELLSSVEGNILDNQDLIDTLSDSKQISDKAEEQLKKAEETQQTIQATRVEYTSVAIRARTLYFVVSSLHHVDPMYQFSLKWFTRLFDIALDRASGSKRKLVERLDSLIYTFTLLFYQNVCRSLFEKDKKLMSFLMTLRIIESEAGYSSAVLDYLLTGNTTMKIEHDNPTGEEKWIPDNVWAHIDGLYHVASGPLKTFLKLLYERPERFRFLMTSDHPVEDMSNDLVKLINRAESSSLESIHELKSTTYPRKNEGTSLGGNAITVGPQSSLMIRYLDSNRQKRHKRRRHHKQTTSKDEQLPQWMLDELGEMTMLDHLAIIRFMRPDKAVNMANDLIMETIGREFIEPVPLDLANVFEDSSFETPLLFILSSGADPMHSFLTFAENKGYYKKTKIISLGQGQGPIAESAINEAIQGGSWVCLQNCHLAASWLPSLERLVNSFTAESVHPDFRLWLTSMPTPFFPVSVLQSAVKMTSEPPKGLRASLLSSFGSITEEWASACEQEGTLRKLLFGLCFLHATTLERRKYGPLGWNIPYEFSESDLQISKNQLKMFLDEAWENADPNKRSEPIVPFKALQYLTAECNYGGRVTDAKDRRCLWALVRHLYSERTLKKEFTICDNTRYNMPVNLDKQSLLDFVHNLPFTESPEVFGLHENADIAAAKAETKYLFSTATILRSKDLAVSTQSGSGDVTEEGGEGGGLLEQVKDMLEKIPAEFDIDEVAKKYPVRHEQSMNTVLRQELFRFNALIRRVRESLFDLQNAEKGLVVMSADLEDIADSLNRGVVPGYWSAVAYPSMKPLGSWIIDLSQRIQFLQKWIEQGHPNAFWLSGFFFTQAFLTGTLQNYARKYKLPIDTIQFDFNVLDDTEDDYFKNGKEAPEDGAYIYGLILEAASWNTEHKIIEDQPPQQLTCIMPIIHFLPKPSSELEKRRQNCHDYTCPVYRTPLRQGTLSTTGHSTNYVLDILLPMHSDDTEDKWIRRGVATVCSTAE